MKPELFLATHSIFTREEFVETLKTRGCAASTADAHLARWRRSGRIVRVKQGVFCRIQTELEKKGLIPDLLTLASRMAPDAVVAYHSALEAHGYAQSVFEIFFFVTWTKTKPVTFRGRRFLPVRPRAPLQKLDGGARWIEKAERVGLELRVTTLERTIADVLDRPDLAGGVEEVWRSLDSVHALDHDRLEEYVTALGNRTLAAKVGFYLETRRDRLLVPETLLERLQKMAPKGPVFMDRRRKGRLLARWGLVVPRLVAEEE